MMSYRIPREGREPAIKAACLHIKTGAKGEDREEDCNGNDAN